MLHAPRTKSWKNVSNQSQTAGRPLNFISYEIEAVVNAALQHRKFLIDARAELRNTRLQFQRLSPQQKRIPYHISMNAKIELMLALIEKGLSGRL